MIGPETGGRSLEIAKNNQRLFETIGVINVLLPASPELRRLTKRIYRLKVTKVETAKPGLKGADLEAWRADAYQRASQFVEQEYDKPIEKLLNYLGRQIDQGER